MRRRRGDRVCAYTRKPVVQGGTYAEYVTVPESGVGKMPPGILYEEAAAIPVAVLTTLMQQNNRLVFASTVHGYEGSGRGFELRFRERLTLSMPQWRELRLRAPVRICA